MIEKTSNMNLKTESDTIVNHKDFVYKSKNSNKIIFFLAILFYSIFFGLMPFTIVFSNIFQDNSNEFLFMEMLNIFILVLTGLASIYLISWIFKGSYNRILYSHLNIMHLVNSIFLFLASIVLCLPFLAAPVNPTTEEWLSFMSSRSMIVIILSFVWAIAFFGTTFYFAFKNKRLFPVVWFKQKLTIFSLLLIMSTFVLSFVLVLLSQDSAKSNDLQLIIYLVTFILMAFNLVYLVLANAYTKAFKESLLYDKTEVELENINNSKKFWFLMKVTMGVIVMIIGISTMFATGWNAENFGIISITNFVIDLLVFFFFVLFVVFQKKKNKTKNNILENRIENKPIKKTTSIDVTSLLKISALIMITKATILSLMTSIVYADAQSLWIIASTGLFTFLIYMFAGILKVNLPNTRITTSLVINLVALVSVLVTVVIVTQWWETGQEQKYADLICLFVLLQVFLANAIEAILQFVMNMKYVQANNNQANEDVEEVVLNASGVNN